MQKKKNNILKVFVAIVLAIAVGSWSGTDKTVLNINLYSVFDVLGSLFINALTLVVVPLVSSSIISGVAKMGGESAFKRVGAKTFAFYIGTSLIAVVIGLAFINVFNPGVTMAGDPILGRNAAEVAQLQDSLLTGQGPSFVRVIMQLVPNNVLMAFSRGNMLGLIFFSILFGYAISKIPEHFSSHLLTFFQGVFHAMIRFTHMILVFLPYGVFFLVAKAFATTTHGFQGLGYFFLSSLSGLLVFMFIGLPLLIRIIGRVSPWKFMKDMGPALITAFSTSSSSAALPVTIDCIEKKTGVSNKIASLVIPLGASINMSGSALYDVVAAMFVIQAYGVDLTFGTQFLVALLALVTSIGVAGVPSGGLVAIIVILKTVGLPAEGIGLFIAVERLLDMARTTVNVFSDSTCALLVARTEGEKTHLKD